MGMYILGVQEGGRWGEEGGGGGRERGHQSGPEQANFDWSGCFAHVF